MGGVSVHRVLSGGYAHHGGKSRQEDRFACVELPIGAVGAVADGASFSETGAEIQAEVACNTFVVTAAEILRSGRADIGEALQTALHETARSCHQKGRELGRAASAFAGFVLTNDGRAAAIGAGDVRVWARRGEEWFDLAGTGDADQIGRLKNYLGLPPEEVMGGRRRVQVYPGIDAVLGATDGVYKPLEHYERSPADSFHRRFAGWPSKDSAPPFFMARDLVDYAVGRATNDNCAVAVLATWPGLTAATRARGLRLGILALVAVLLVAAGFLAGARMAVQSKAARATAREATPAKPPAAGKGDKPARAGASTRGDRPPGTTPKADKGTPARPPDEPKTETVKREEPVAVPIGTKAPVTPEAEPKVEAIEATGIEEGKTAAADLVKDWTGVAGSFLQDSPTRERDLYFAWVPTIRRETIGPKRGEPLNREKFEDGMGNAEPLLSAKTEVAGEWWGLKKGPDGKLEWRESFDASLSKLGNDVFLDETFSALHKGKLVLLHCTNISSTGPATCKFEEIPK